ncbi:MAG TPA: hypothetical protein VJP80_06500 [Candidatus Saccharimonadales bacterium]|nr:hypothetical protein [Candidatus Saccharimonadales bacterium]
MKRHKTLFVAFAVMLVLVGGLIFWATLNERHENVSKQLLLQEVGHLPLPSSCVEQSRSYQRGGVDTQSSWHVVYRCSAAADAISNEIAQGLQHRNYVASNNGPGVLHFQNPNFQVDYDVIADSPVSTTTSVSIYIYRLGRSY